MTSRAALADHHLLLLRAVADGGPDGLSWLSFSEACAPGSAQADFFVLTEHRLAVLKEAPGERRLHLTEMGAGVLRGFEAQASERDRSRMPIPGPSSPSAKNPKRGGKAEDVLVTIVLWVIGAAAVFGLLGSCQAYLESPDGVCPVDMTYDYQGGCY